MHLVSSMIGLQGMPLILLSGTLVEQPGAWYVYAAFSSNCLSSFRGNSIGARFLCNPSTIYEYLRIELPEGWLPPEAIDLEDDVDNPV